QGLRQRPARRRAAKTRHRACRPSPPATPQDPRRQAPASLQTPLVCRAPFRLASTPPTDTHPLRDQAGQFPGLHLARLPPNPDEAFMRCALAGHAGARGAMTVILGCTPRWASAKSTSRKTPSKPFMLTSKVIIARVEAIVQRKGLVRPNTSVTSAVKI